MTKSEEEGETHPFWSVIDSLFLAARLTGKIVVAKSGIEKRQKTTKGRE